MNRKLAFGLLVGTVCSQLVMAQNSKKRNVDPDPEIVTVKTYMTPEGHDASIAQNQTKMPTTKTLDSRNNRDALNTQEALFTLPIPRYKLPKDIQNLIMFSITTDGNRESVQRDEYKIIYMDKKKLKSWLSGALEHAISVRIGANTNEINEASRRQDVYALTGALNRWSAIRDEQTPRWERWQAYAKSNW